MYLNNIYSSLVNGLDNPAICTEDEIVSYAALFQRVNGIRKYIRNNVSADQKGVGIITFSHPDTYAAILALWFENKYYVPLLPSAPVNRNNSVIEESSIKLVLSNSSFKQDLTVPQVRLDKIDSSSDDFGFDENGFNVEANAYILFTSGSTGKPKGVVIRFANVEAFTQSMIALGREVYSTDRCLQMFELTFDMSVDSYVMPLMVGACIYLIPDGAIKFNYVLDLLEEYHLTVLTLVPSVIIYLRVFFKAINEPQVRICTFAGEGLPADVTAEWQRCIPNATIYNFYGPTECTVYCTYYPFDAKSPKIYNGGLSIGQPMPGCKCDIFSDDGEMLPYGEKGELCLSGPQLTCGYWNNPDKNAESFFIYNGERYYHSGDLCYKDEDGDVFHCGRIDYQVKIQGFRVELNEIEFYAREATDNKLSCVCVPYHYQSVLNIGLAIETADKDYPVENVLEHIRKSLPPYETPSKVVLLPAFPLTTSGKINRKEITSYFEKS